MKEGRKEEQFRSLQPPKQRDSDLSVEVCMVDVEIKEQISLIFERWGDGI